MDDGLNERPAEAPTRAGLRRREHVLLLILGLAASAARLEAQASPGWSIRLEAGPTEIHRGTATGGMLRGVLGRAVGQGHVHVELGLAAGTADEGFVTIGAGPELRLFPHRRVSPTAAVQVGLLAEPEFVGAGASVSAGLLARPAPDLAFRGAVSRGTHGGKRGPHALVLGVEVSFGDGRDPSLRP